MSFSNVERCILCGGLQQRLLYKTSFENTKEKKTSYRMTEHSLDKNISVVCCQQCGFLFLNPRPSDVVLIEQYKTMKDEAYIKEEDGRREYARKILKEISQLQKTTGRLLDIGCACGFLLDEARKQGWEVYGVEFSNWAVEYAQKELKLEKVFKEDLLKMNFSKNFFDVVIMTDVIEHLSCAQETLEYIRQILQPQGYFCCTTPDVDSLPRKILKTKWWGFHQTHLYYFNRKTLAQLLLKTGFTPVKTRTFPRVFSLGYWIQGFSQYGILGRFLLRCVTWFPRFKNILISLNLSDQLFMISRKSRSMKYLHELESCLEETSDKAHQKVVVVLPAYQAKKTLEITIKDIPKENVQDILLVDDASQDGTFDEALRLGIKAFRHERNQGYGANQKTCYQKALQMGADIVVMVHPDYQYDPKAIPQLIEPILMKKADAVFGSRMMKGGALEGGMPKWKYNANILLTALENVILGIYLTEYHSGFRAYSKKYLTSINVEANSNGFVFDTEIIVQGVIKKMRFEEVPIRTRYFDEASSIKFWPCVYYGVSILKVLLKFLCYKVGWRFKQFQ